MAGCREKCTLNYSVNRLSGSCREMLNKILIARNPCVQLTGFLVLCINLLKGLRPLPPADSRIFGFWDFSENVDFGNFPLGLGVWEGLQWIGKGCGLQMDGLSAHFEPSGSIFDDFHDFDDFAFVSGRLSLFPEGPRTSESALRSQDPVRVPCPTGL